MSKKRSKSGVGSASVQRWEQGLLSAPFVEEDKWNATIAFIVGGQIEDFENINILAHTVNTGVRKLFSIITAEDLYNQVRDLGNPKGKKAKEVPANYEVCEPCKLYLDNDEEIPLPLLAKLLKFRLLDIKSRDIKRRELELKIASDKEKAAKGGGKGGKERGKSPGGKGKGKGAKTPEPPTAKEGSKLKKRGEEDQDNKYIDDEPDDGPQHYIFVTGFHNPHFLSHLSDININVDSIIRMDSEDYTRYEVDPDMLEEEVEKDEKKLALEEEQRVLKEKQRVELKTFWKDILLLMQNAPPNSHLHNVARLAYTVKSAIIPENLEDLEKKNAFGIQMFEDTACMVYNILDAKRQWQNYLTNLKLLKVPLITQLAQPSIQEVQSQPSVMTPAVPKPATDALSHMDSEHKAAATADVDLVDMRYYNDLMNAVPSESVSIPLIMHCMLEQVNATEQMLDPPSEVHKPQRPDGLDEALAAHVASLAFKLSLSKEEQEVLESEFENPKTREAVQKQPLLVNHHDQMTRRLAHLKSVDGIDPMKAELEMQGYLPVTSKLDFHSPTAKDAKERAARLQELLTYVSSGALHQHEIDHAFRQFVFECMELTEVDEDCEVKVKFDTGDQCPQRDIPYDDPYPYFSAMMLPAEKLMPEPEPEAEAVPSKETDVKEASPTRSLSPGTALPTERDSLHLGADAATMRSGSASSSRSSSASGSRSGRSKTKKRAGSAGKKKKEKSQRPATPSSPAPAEEQEGRPPSASHGILKRSDSATSRKSGSVVHFGSPAGDGCVAGHPGDESSEMLETERRQQLALQTEMWEHVNEGQKRNLDQWCFAEHMKPSVLLQVLGECQYNLPYLDTYYHRRDNTLLVVMHNPYGQQLTSTTQWETNLHSNVGFRNYLELIAPSIEDWTIEEEAKYQASLLAKEVEKNAKEAEEAASRATSPSKADKKGRGKSGKKDPKSPRAKSPMSSTERTPRDPFIRQGSLKAWQAEQDAIKAEEAERERQKAEKAEKSSKKGKESVDEKAQEKPAKRSGSRQSAKSRASKEELVPPAEKDPEGAGTDPELFFPFMGYDVGNNIIHASGSVTTMFPADGGQIRSEKVTFKQSSNIVKASVLKDGHVMSVHIIDPKVPGQEEDEEEEVKKEATAASPLPTVAEEGEEKADAEKSEKVSSAENTGENLPPKTPCMGKPEPEKPCVGRFGSFTCQFKDGLSLAVSTYGQTGEPEDGKKYEPAPYVMPLPRSPTPMQKESPAKGKKGKDKTPEPIQEVVPEPEPEEPPIPHQPFQPLSVSCPDGLVVTYLLESEAGIAPVQENQRRLLVRQSYPYKTSGVQNCEARRAEAMSEVSRVLTSDGTVIKTRTDGTVLVMFADGTISEYLPHAPIVKPPGSRGSSARSTSAKSDVDAGVAKKSRSKASKKSDDEGTAEDEKAAWMTTLSTGEKICTLADGSNTIIPVPPAMVSTATDPFTKQVMKTRDDRTVHVQHPDGTVIVEHGDGTRITTMTHTMQVANEDEDVNEEEETGEEPATEEQQVTIYQIECPGFATVKFDSMSTECSTEFGSGTVIHAFPVGSYDVYHQDGGYLRIEKDGSSMYYPRPNNDLELFNAGQQLQYSFRHFADVVVETVDNEGNVFNVSHTGETVVMTPNGEVVPQEEELEEKQDNAEKDIVVTRRIQQYKQHAPRLFVIHRDGSGTELLRYHDVAEYISQAEDDPTTAILMDPLPDYPGVVGITVMRPYLRDCSQQWLKPYQLDTIVPLGLVSRDLKTLPAREVKKDGPAFGTTTGQGLAIGSRVQGDMQVPLSCPQILEVRQILQYRPVSEELRERMQQGVQSYAQGVRDRTLNAAAMQINDPRSEEEKERAEALATSVLAALLSETTAISADVKETYEKATAPPEPSPPPTPQPKRTKADWERDQRDLALEKENRAALRNKDVPKYFDSEIGKAFLLSQAPDMAALAKELAADPRKDSSRAIFCSHNQPPPTENSPTPSDSNDQNQRRASNPPHTTMYSTASVDMVEVEGNNYTILNPHAPMYTTGSVDMVEVGESQNNNNLIQTPSPYAMTTGNTPSALRPGNPTPAHAQGVGSPNPVRPGNPTPAHAQKKSEPTRPEGPTPKQPRSSVHRHSSIVERPYEETPYPDGPIVPSAGSDIINTRSLAINVTGEQRKTPVKPPAYLYSNRPAAQPNSRFTEVEDPVRRKVNTSSMAGATMKGSKILARMRGIEVLPDRCDMGVLREGSTYSFPIYLKNTGTDTCRFKIKQPPPGTGIKVIYKPGPIAAGMKGCLEVEIYAIAVGVEGGRGVGSITHDLQIITETDIIYLPITATVLTANEYDNRDIEAPSGGKAPGVKYVSNKPPGTMGIIRPRSREIEGYN